MSDKRSWVVILIFIMFLSLGTTNTAFADENSTGILSGLTKKIFSKDENWKKDKEIKYKEQFKSELLIEDQIERIDFSINYVEVYHAEINDKPTIMFIGRTKSGRDLIDIIYDESDMYKYYRYQKMDGQEKRKFLQDNFAKYEVDLAASENRDMEKEVVKPENRPSESLSTQVVAPMEPAVPQTATRSSEQQYIKERLRTLNSLREDGLITKQEYDSIRIRILSEL